MAIAALDMMLRDTLEAAREHAHNMNSRGESPDFAKGDFVLMARDNFPAGEKLSIHWRGPRRVVEALSDNVFRVEHLKTGLVENFRGSCLKVYPFT